MNHEVAFSALSPAALIINILAVWRVAHLLWEEDGPFKIIIGLRRLRETRSLAALTVRAFVSRELTRLLCSRYLAFGRQSESRPQAHEYKLISGEKVRKI